MANFFNDNEDLRFYMDTLDWGPLVELMEANFKAEDGFKDTEEAVSFYRDILEMVGEFSSKEVAPRAADMDRLGLTMMDGDVILNTPMETIFKKIKRLDLHGISLPREVGGMNCPATLYFLASELFARSDVSITAHLGFHVGIASVLLQASIAEGSTEFDRQKRCIKSTRFEDEISEIISGRAWGAMDLTEPDAGSDMAAIRCKGEQNEAGEWFLSGQKIFLTSGNGRWHIVIARTEPNEGKTAGLKGLSLFVSPIYTKGRGRKKEWHATIERLEEKIGHHTSPTVSVNFDKTPARLLGKRGDGFKYMLMLMNHARIGVAFESLGIMEAARRLATEYAAERPSMGKTIDRHEMIADYLDEMKVEAVGLRAMAVRAAIADDMAHHYHVLEEFYAEPDSEEQVKARREARKYKAVARRLTPLIKYMGGEKSVEHSRRAIQILGGVGYCQEYGAEKLLRDALVLPIYEGTSQIQALMVMKDTMNFIMRNPQEFLKNMAQARWRSLSARDPLERRLAKLQVLSCSAQQHLIQRTATDKFKSLGGTPIPTWPKAFLQNWDPKRDFSYALLHAENLTLILIDEAVAELLWEQAEQHESRRPYLEAWLERAEPHSRYLFEKMHTGERLLASLASLM